MIDRLVLAAIIMLAACRKEGGNTDAPAPAAPSTADPVAETPATETPEVAEPAADGDACVSKCVAGRQMEAISAEMIEKECQADCASGKLESQ